MEINAVPELKVVITGDLRIDVIPDRKMQIHKLEEDEEPKAKATTVDNWEIYGIPD